MEQISLAKKIGGSVFVKLSQQNIIQQNITEGNSISFNPQKVIDILEFKCTLCNYVFSAENTDDIYCPCCGCETREEIQELCQTKI